MANKDQYKAADFIKAIKGSGGIISTIASRVGCDWNTAKKYITAYTTIKDAYDAEIEANTDTAESVVITNIKATIAIQQRELRLAQLAESSGNDKEAIAHYRLALSDATDAKWWLTRKGKDRGFTERSELTGADGGDLTLTLKDWRSERQRRLDEAAEINGMFNDDDLDTKD